MSGVASSIGKVFTAVGQTAAKVTQAVAGVGATVFTAGAATGAPAAVSGGLSSVAKTFSSGTGVLGNILNGAANMIGGVVDTVGQALSSGLGMGTTSPGVDTMTTSGIRVGDAAAPKGDRLLSGTPTTEAPSTLSDSQFSTRFGSNPATSAATTVAAPLTDAATTPQAASAGTGFLSFLKDPEVAGGLISGLGKGLGAYMDQRAKEKEAEAQRDFNREQYQRVQDSYSVDPAAISFGTPAPATTRPTPAERYARPGYRYDRSTGSLVWNT